MHNLYIIIFICLIEILKAKKKGGFIILQADENFIAPIVGI